LTSIAITDSEAMLTAVAGQRIPRRAWGDVTQLSNVLTEADRTLQSAKRQAELLQRRAYFDGRAAGISNAQSEAIKHILEAQRQAREVLSNSDARVIELAVAIVERMAPRLEQTDFVALLAAEGLAAIREERRISVRIGSSAEKPVRAMLDKWQLEQPQVEKVDMVIDPALEPMACVIETELGRIEVGLPAQLEAIRTSGVSALEHLETVERVGRAAEIRAGLIRATGIEARIGEVCELKDGDRILSAEVVAIERGVALLTPLGTLDGFSSAAEVVAKGNRVTVAAGDALLGRALDALGHVIDGQPAPTGRLTEVPVYRDPPDAMTRTPSRQPFPTGIKPLDAALTVGEGQRIGLFGPSGSSITSMLGLLSQAGADVNVIVLLGGRGSEVRSFIDPKNVVVVATADRPALERVRAAYVGTAIAEHFRDEGKRVLLLLDSVTRFAKSLREVGLAAGEPAVRGGYPASVYCALPRLFERAGNTYRGSITAFYTGLFEDEGEPMAAEVRSLLDGHINLSRKPPTG
jgi:ATP synthase in type III secretion protein N